MALLLLDSANIATTSDFRLRIKASMANRAQEILADVNATLEEVNWARRSINNLDNQLDVVAWYVASINSVTLATNDSALKAHVAAAVAILAVV
jgi:rRNA-processing protein FCF1